MVTSVNLNIHFSLGPTNNSYDVIQLPWQNWKRGIFVTRTVTKALLRMR